MESKQAALQETTALRTIYSIRQNITTIPAINKCYPATELCRPKMTVHVSG